MKIVHQNLLLLFGGNVKEYSKNEGSQQAADGPPDCILTVSDDGVPETEVVSTYPEPMGNGVAICVECVQNRMCIKYCGEPEHPLCLGQTIGLK